MAILYVQDNVPVPETPTPSTPKQSNLGESMKFQLRRAKIQEMERLQDLEDQQDAKMTSEQYQLLNDTFAQVKSQFVDLDGQSWEGPDAQMMLAQWRLKQVPLTAKNRRTFKAAPFMTRSSGCDSVEDLKVPTTRNRASIPSAFTTLEDERALHAPSRVALHPVFARATSDADGNATVTGTRYNAGTWSGTLGRSVRNGPRERPILPSFTMGRTSNAMERRPDVPRMLEPMRRVLTEEGTQEGEEDSTHGSVLGGSLRAGHVPVNRCSPRSPRSPCSPRSPSSPRFRYWGSKPMARRTTFYLTTATPRYITVPPTPGKKSAANVGLGLAVPS